MVGIPRSKGCRICVQRRVRCDLTRPFCKNCKKGDRPCPGYPADLKFQDEGEKLRKRYDKSATPNSEDESKDAILNVFDIQTLDPLASSPVGRKYREGPFFDLLESPEQYLFPSEADEAERQAIDAEIETTAQSTDALALFAPNTLTLDELVPFGMRFQHANLNQNQLFANFANALNVSHGRWLSHLPDFTGQNPLLDAAIRSVSLAHLGRLHNSDLFLNEARPHYGKALRLMSRSLKDDVQSMDPTVLCATMLLSFYEMFTSDSNESWIRHAGGAGALMKMRGPQRHRYGFDREMFLAYRHTIIIEAFQNDEACFLDEPEWRQVSADIHAEIRVNGVEETRLQIFDLAEEFYKEMASIPELFRDSRHLQDDVVDPLERLVVKEELIQRFKDHRLRMKTTYMQFQASLRDIGHAPTSYASGDDVFPLYVDYINIFVASSLTGYWTVLILVNTIIQQLQQDQVTSAMYAIENKEAASDICKTVAYMLISSFLGPFFAMFGLRVCLHVFETGSFERDWVVRKLTEIGNSRMKIARAIPKFTPSTPLRFGMPPPDDPPRLKEV